ncbi:MAG: hypothetical protein BroJett003_21120 [Planctomycetota bacterium]|nr:MAG: hypothetical protein BroJett003_21120 [Planctomycetota bacterium]
MLTWVSAAVAGAATGIGGIQFQIDSGASTAQVELCVLGECDSDSSSLTGDMTAVFNCPDAPGEISIEDFEIRVAETISLHLDYGFLGDIFATGEGVAVLHDGPPEPFTPVIGGAFNAPGVAYIKQGRIDYEASGIVCSTMQSFGYPCEATFFLEQQPPAAADLPGSVSVQPAQLVLTGTLDILEPLDPNNPDLGTIRITATIRATAPRPDTGAVRKFKANCRRGKLKSVLVMSDESSDGQTARFSVNDEVFTATIRGDKAKLVLPNRTGMHTVRLLDPPHCEGTRLVDCG